MMCPKFRPWLLLARLGVCAVVGSAAIKPAHAADPFFYAFNEVYSGIAPTASPPWLSASFSTIAPGEVSLTISALALSGSENLRQLYLNFNPAYNPRHLRFDVTERIGAFSAPAIATGKNAFKAGGDGYFDLLFTFSTDLSDNLRFNGGESITLSIKGVPSLSAEDFAYLSNSGGSYGPFYAAAHVQRTGATGADSGWTYAGPPQMGVIPEPSAAVLLLLGLGGLVTRRFLRTPQ